MGESSWGAAQDPRFARALLAPALLLLFLLALSATAAQAHDEDQPLPPTPEEIARIEPPIPGSEAFARGLLVFLGMRRDARQQVILGRIAAHLRALDHLMLPRAADTPAAGSGGGNASPREADYHRWHIEKDLRELLALLPASEHAVLDFRGGRRPAHDPDQPTALDRRVPHLLLSVITGDGPTRFDSRATVDLAREGSPETRPIPIQAGGTTHLLLALENAPSGDRFVETFAFREEDSSTGRGGAAAATAATFFHAFSFHTPADGHLALEIRDENNRPMPVLARLSAKTGGGAAGRVWPLSGALDFTDMMNRVTRLPIYGPGRAYTVYIPGAFQGPYWVMPEGASETTLPAGEWEVHLWHGLEYTPVRETIRIEEGKWERRVIRLKRWTDMPARGWFSSDDHIHSRLMSGEDADRLMAWARAADIHIANILEMGDSARTWYPQRGFGPEFRVSEKSGRHWLIPGQEDPRSMLGHAIGLNLKSRVRDVTRYYLNDWLADQIHRQGGLYGHTHVGENALMVHREMALFQPSGIVDFNSILQNRLGTELFYDFLNLGFKMTASAGSDTPYGGTVGSVRVYAYIGKKTSDLPDRWFDALKRGRTFVTNGPMLEFRVENALPGDEVRIGAGPKGDRPLRVHARAWGIPGGSAPVRLRLIRFGKVIHEASATRSDQGALEFTIDVEPGQGCWLALHTAGRDGSEAHTTPIYVTRDGLRFWDTAQAGTFLDRQMAVMDEIEREIRVSEELIRSGNRPLDYYNRRIAEQAEPLRERIRDARAFYAGLKAQLESQRNPQRKSRTEGKNVGRNSQR